MTFVLKIPKFYLRQLQSMQNQSDQSRSHRSFTGSPCFRTHFEHLLMHPASVHLEKILPEGAFPGRNLTTYLQKWFTEVLGHDIIFYQKGTSEVPPGRCFKEILQVLTGYVLQKRKKKRKMINIRNNTSTNALGNYLKAWKEQFLPLTKTEERELILRHMDDPDTMRRLLVQHNVRLVFSLARKYAPTSVDFDELIGRGFEGLCIAAKKFDPSRNIKFCTYATPWVFKYIVKEYFDREVVRSKTGISMDSFLKGSSEEGATFENVVQNFMSPTEDLPGGCLSVDEAVCQNEKEEIFTNLLQYVEKDSAFDDLDRQIFQRNILEKESIKSLSADLNLQYAVTSRRKREILLKLKDFLSSKYGIRSLEEF